MYSPWSPLFLLKKIYTNMCIHISEDSIKTYTNKLPRIRLVISGRMEVSHSYKAQGSNVSRLRRCSCNECCCASFFWAHLDLEYILSDKGLINLCAQLVYCYRKFSLSFNFRSIQYISLQHKKSLRLKFSSIKFFVRFSTCINYTFMFL